MPADRPKPRADTPTVLLHWTLFLVLLGSLATGFRISADRLDGGWASALVAVLPQGDVFRWHLLAGFAVTLVMLAYATFLFVAGVRRRVALERGTLAALTGSSSRRRLKSANRLVYWLGFVLLALATGTGIAHYLMPPFVPQETLLLVHRASAWSLLAYTLLHVALQATAGGFDGVLKILKPRARYGLAALAATGVAVLAGGAILSLDRTSLQTLEVAGVEAPDITLDGQLDEAVWRTGEPLAVQTSRGVNHDDGEVRIDVRAVHDGETLHIAFEWPDETRSQKHLPLVKGEDGWRVLQERYGMQDENRFYEDKFAVMWGREARAAGNGTVHMGARPLDDKPGPSGGRGLHYTTDGGIVDVWHWKSVRTGSPLAQRMDDNYFGPPMEVDPEKSRYTGGYAQDPSDGGGYTMNWQSFEEGVVEPKALPADPATLERLGDVDTDPAASDDGEFWLAESETVPYDEALDDYPVGTVMPSVIVAGPHEGDRGDVVAAADWHDGRWTIEARRPLRTGSEFDLTFDPDEPLHLWLAAFDHAQTRHTYHLRPIRVAFHDLDTAAAPEEIARAAR